MRQDSVNLTIDIPAEVPKGGLAEAVLSHFLAPRCRRRSPLTPSCGAVLSEDSTFRAAGEYSSPLAGIGNSPTARSKGSFIGPTRGGRYRPFRMFVHMELKDVRSRVVADNIKIVLAPNNLRSIDFGGQNRLIFTLGPARTLPNGSTMQLPPRVTHFGIVAISSIVISRKVAAAIELIAGKHEATAFDGDVAHRRRHDSRESAVGAQ